MNFEYLNLKQSAEWAANYTNSDVNPSNISYLLQYGRLKKYGNGRIVLVNKDELKTYYDSLIFKEIRWKEKLGDDLNWKLSFSEYKESERTKHVHRLHPYKGKFIPQLVEYFLDPHIDEFKKEACFRKGDTVLDPFCGSGTTLVQANELGIHAIGVDVSFFNSLISNVKVKIHDLSSLLQAIKQLSLNFENYRGDRTNHLFERHLLAELNKFNSTHFPVPEYRRKVNSGEIDEKVYSLEMERIFMPIFSKLSEQYQIAAQSSDDTFMGKWYLVPVREEMSFLFEELKKAEYEPVRDVITIILSRVARSCRATTHADLGTLKEPVTATYYCKKHGKICKPLFSINNWWKRYTVDTLKRLDEFQKLRTDTHQLCLKGDSRKIDVFKEVSKHYPQFARTILAQKIKGIFSSPPYVGVIDYHDQHAYAYEMFGFNRDDGSEIGPLSSGQGKEARNSYTEAIARVLSNSKQFLADDYDIFLVANDKHNLYPEIAKLAHTRIVNQYKRPVLNRVEKDRSTAYSETIFHLKEE